MVKVYELNKKQFPTIVLFIFIVLAELVLMIQGFTSNNWEDKKPSFIWFLKVFVGHMVMIISSFLNNKM